MGWQFRLLLLVAPIASVLPLHVAHSQPYPSKPIRLIAPYAPGGTSDRIVRPLAQKLIGALGAQIVVENRGGGGSIIGADIVAKATADGYTLLLCSVATHASSPQLYSKVPYDPFKHFDPIILLASSPILLAAYNKLPIETVKELVDTAKAHPGKLSYASSGSGSPPHLAAEIFGTMAGIKMLHVPYKGGGESTPDLIAGRVDLKFDSAPGVMPQVRASRLKAIAIAAASRWPDLPNVPTFSESGWPQYLLSSWFGLCAPAGVPRAVVDRINQETRKVLASAEYRDWLHRLGAVPAGNSPQEFRAFIRSEYEKYGRVIKATGARID